MNAWKYAPVVLALGLWGCVTPAGTDLRPGPGQMVASWYGEPFHGRATSSGEIYDMNGFTAAHKTLPFGTWLEVKNPADGRIAVIKINDRGPFIENRDLDLSYAAARQIGLMGSGVMIVDVRRVSGPSLVPVRAVKVSNPVADPLPRAAVTAGTYAVQVGSFAHEPNAQGVAGLLRVRYTPVTVNSSVADGRTLYRVMVGAYKDQAVAAATRKQLAKEGYNGKVVIRSE